MSTTTSWKMRSKEVGILFNPAFCCVVLSSSVIGYATENVQGMSFTLAYLVLPLVLHKHTRAILPLNTRTSLAAWLEENPSVRIQFHERVTSLRPLVGESILFGYQYNWLSIQSGYITSTLSDKRVRGFLQKTQGEARECIMRARLVGKWFAASGPAETVLGLWEIRP